MAQRCRWNQSIGHESMKCLECSPTSVCFWRLLDHLCSGDQCSGDQCYIRKASPSRTIKVNFSGRYICATAVDSASHSACLADDRGARVGGVRVVLGRSAKRLPVWRVPVLSLAAFVGQTIVFALLFWPKTGVSTLGTRFVPHHSAIVETGFVAALVGLAIAAWVRVHLRRYWSDKVVIQPDHIRFISEFCSL